MEKYDSSIETLKHIKQVGAYLTMIKDILNNDIETNKDINQSSDYVTLVDLLHLLYNGHNIPNYSKMFCDINNNSLPYKYGVFYTDKDELLTSFIEEIDERMINHDKSKLEEPEKHEFDIYTPRIQEAILGTPMYEYFLKELKKALRHHYRYNRHHPEHFGNGMNGMTIMDITEMLCDWMATSERHDNSSIYDSIEILSNRFNYTAPMKKILSNTCETCFKKSK